MRASSYIIKIKTNINGQYVLVHGYTGAIDIVKKNVIDFLNDIDNSQKAISIKTINILKQRGYITEKTYDEEIEYVKKMAEILQKNALLKNPKSFYFIPAYECNFKCSYCYEAQISRNGEGWSGEVMTEKMVDKAYELIDNFKKVGSVNNTINLYGGEPFLKKNSKIVKYILKKGIEKNLKFGAITNGYELDEFKEFLGKGKIEKVQITLDGPPKTHNSSRYLYDGTPTFQKIANNISLSLSKKVEVNIRINVDKNNIKEVNELDDIFKNYGWKDSQYFNAYIALKRAYGLEEKCNIFSKEGDLASEWIKIVSNSPNSKIGTVDRGITKVLNDSIVNNKIIRFKSSYCGANSSMYLFDPLGDIYTCWEVVKQKKCKVGEYFPEYIINQESLNNWHNRHIGNIEKCTRCKYAFFCGGGCEGQLFSEKGKFFSSYCNDFPNLFKKYLLHTLNTNKDIREKIFI